MAEEEVLGEEEAVQDQADEADEPDDDGGLLGGLFSLGGGMNSMMIQILMGLIGVVALIAIVMGTVYWTQTTMSQNTAQQDDDSVEAEPGGSGQAPYNYFTIENDFVITKQSPEGQRRTLKVQVVLAYDDQNSAVKSELDQRLPQIRDLISRILGTKNVRDLRYENRGELKEDIKAEINRILTRQGRIGTIFFKEYVFQ